MEFSFLALRQFGQPIGSFQALKHMAAEMVSEIEPARSLVWYAVYAFDHLHFWFKRAKWNETTFGDPTFHRERVAQLAGL